MLYMIRSVHRPYVLFTNAGAPSLSFPLGKFLHLMLFCWQLQHLLFLPSLLLPLLFFLFFFFSKHVVWTGSHTAANNSRAKVPAPHESCNPPRRYERGNWKWERAFFTAPPRQTLNPASRVIGLGFGFLLSSDFVNHKLQWFSGRWRHLHRLSGGKHASQTVSLSRAMKLWLRNWDAATAGPRRRLHITQCHRPDANHQRGYPPAWCRAGHHIHFPGSNVSLLQLQLQLQPFLFFFFFYYIMQSMLHLRTHTLQQ